MASNVEKKTPLTPFSLPDTLTVEQKIVMCIGQLVTGWANCESLLRAVFVSVAGGSTQESSDFAEITWLSLSNEKNRRDILIRCTTASSLPEAFKAEILRLCERFKAISTTRNFYCHAGYEADPESGDLVAVESHNLTYDDRLVKSDRRLADTTMVRQIMGVIENCEVLNQELWGLLIALKEETKAPFPELPALPDGYPRIPTFHPQQKG